MQMLLLLHILSWLFAFRACFPLFWPAAKRSEGNSRTRGKTKEQSIKQAKDTQWMTLNSLAHNLQKVVEASLTLLLQQYTHRGHLLYLDSAKCTPHGIHGTDCVRV